MKTGGRKGVFILAQEQRCQRLRTLQLGPAPDQGPDPDLTPDLTLEAAPVQDPENVAIVLGLVPALALTLRPTETILPGTIRTTEVVSEATTEATGGPSTTVAETEAFTHAAITRTGEEAVAMAISPIGRGVVVVVVEEAGMIATMTKTTTHIAPGEGGHAPAHPKSAQAAGAAPATLTAHLHEDLDTLGAPATHHGPGPHHHAIAAARASLAPRMLRAS